MEILIALGAVIMAATLAGIVIASLPAYGQ